MKKNINAYALGGTLFIPANHKHLTVISYHDKFPALRSIVIDFEDGLTPRYHDNAFNNFKTLLPTLKPIKNFYRFIRPKSPEMLNEFLKLENISNIDGFILPKFSLQNCEKYLALLGPTSFQFMPSIEGEELFDSNKLISLRKILQPYHDRVILIRFGAEDMLKQLGLIKSESLYKMLVPQAVISSIMMTFKPYGFDVSAPVFKAFKDNNGFSKEVTYELENGFVSKTIIHPNQIELLNNCYKVSQKEYDLAKKLLSSHDVVFAVDGEMAETATQSAWAQRIINRFNIYNYNISTK
jgi:citrate lyase beta subunit